MSDKTHSDVCGHINQVLDEHEGIYICTDCAKVIENFFQDVSNIYGHENNNFFEKNNEKISSEITSRLNIPNLNIGDEKNELKSVSNVYIYANKTDCTVTLKEISAVSGFTCKQIGKETKNTIQLINLSSLLDKYCKILTLDYKTYTLIKETIEKLEPTGHNPLTIVAANIYIHLKKTKTKLSMKKICDTIGISPISIQRYLKRTQ